MTTYRPGDVVLLAFPFTAPPQVKRRPALVLLDAGDADILVARITTQPYRSSHDVALTDWSSAGLLDASVVRLHKLATLEKSLVARALGSISESDRQSVGAVLRRLFAGW